MRSLVEGHGKVRAHLAEIPGCNDATALAIHDGDLRRIRDIDEDARIGGIELKRLRMCGELDGTRHFFGCRIDDGQCASIADIDLSGRGIVANVIGVFQSVDVCAANECRARKEIDATAAAVGDEQRLRFGQPGDTLRLLQRLEAHAAPPGAKIDHLDAVVSERGDEQTLAIEIDVEMIDAAADIGQRDGLYKRERFRRLRERGADERKRAGAHRRACKREGQESDHGRPP